jgi:phage-related protein
VAEQAYAYVTLIPVAKGFQQAVAKEMGGVNNVGKKAGDDAGKGFSSGFGTAIKGLAVVGGALAVAGITSFLKDSVKASSDLNESLNAVSVSFGSATQGIVSLGETAANRLGLSAVQFNAIATQFSGFATNIVGPGGDVVGFIDELTTRGADFASVFNLDVDEALRLFQSGLAGETEPLRKFGIDLSAATVEAFAYANGIAAAGSPLTEQQKQVARYGALLEQTNKVQGDFANTSDGLANAQRILAANFANVQAEVGGPLLGAFANLTTALIPVVQQLGPVLVDVIGQLAPVITDLAGELPSLLVGLMPLLPILGELAKVFLDIVGQLLPVFVQLFSALLPIIIELLPIVALFVSDVLMALVPILLEIVTALIPLVESLLPIFLKLFEALLPVTIELINAMLPLIELLLPILIGLIEFLAPILVIVADIFGKLLVGAIQQFAGALTYGINFIKQFGDEFTYVFNAIGDFFYKIINGMIAGFEGFVNTTVDALNAVIDALNSIQVKAPKWVTDLTGMTSFGFALSRLNKTYFQRLSTSLPAAPTFMAKGGLVTGPTNAIVGEAGPELVIPLDRFESMMNSGGDGRTVNYYAAPNKSFDAEQELRLAMTRARVLA